MKKYTRVKDPQTQEQNSDGSEKTVFALLFDGSGDPIHLIWPGYLFGGSDGYELNHTTGETRLLEVTFYNEQNEIDSIFLKRDHYLVLEKSGFKITPKQEFEATYKETE